jgi:hypothetical protein
MMNPLLAVAVSQAATWLVTSTVMYCPARVTGMPVCTGAPGPGVLLAPLTVLSDHPRFAAEMSIAPGVVTVLTNSRSLADTTLLPVKPGGNWVRSKISRPCELLAPPTVTVG